MQEWVGGKLSASVCSQLAGSKKSQLPEPNTSSARIHILPKSSILFSTSEWFMFLLKCLWMLLVWTKGRKQGARGARVDDLTPPAPSCHIWQSAKPQYLSCRNKKNGLYIMDGPLEPRIPWWDVQHRDTERPEMKNSMRTNLKSKMLRFFL